MSMFWKIRTWGYLANLSVPYQMSSPKLDVILKLSAIQTESRIRGTHSEMVLYYLLIPGITNLIIRLAWCCLIMGASVRFMEVDSGTNADVAL